ncbi:MAG: Uma2 family endonuclease [Planctomycetes bacterium]|nr:Uma2 family endonuclease [Planctomycetota bacterium]
MLTVTDPSLVVSDAYLRQDLIAERRASGNDRYDEVWEGVYVVMPLPDVEHQYIVTRSCTIFDLVVGVPEQASVLAGVNISDRRDEWTHNYRCPDAAVYLPGNKAVNCGTHWVGGPDFGLEIRSPGNHALEKLDFYARIGTRELMIIDRDPWSLELFRLQGERLESVGRVTLQQSNEPETSAPGTLDSEVLPLRFGLVAGSERPQIEVTHRESGQRWLI